MFNINDTLEDVVYMYGNGTHESKLSQNLNLWKNVLRDVWSLQYLSESSSTSLVLLKSRLDQLCPSFEINESLHQAWSYYDPSTGGWKESYDMKFSCLCGIWKQRNHNITKLYKHNCAKYWTKIIFMNYVLSIVGICSRAVSAFILWMQLSRNFQSCACLRLVWISA